MCIFPLNNNTAFFKVMNAVEKFIRQIRRYKLFINEQKVYVAFGFVEQLILLGHLSRSNEERVIELLKFIVQFHPDEDTIIGSILVDAANISPNYDAEIQSVFGLSVFELISNFNNLKRLKLLNHEEKNVDNLRKLFLVMAKDLRVVIISLCDKVRMLYHIEDVPFDSRKSLLLESLYVFSPIASRLGIFQLKKDLEDLSFKYLFPNEFADIVQQVRLKMKRSKTDIMDMRVNLEKFLESQSIKAYIYGRKKHYYSIYLKLKRKSKNSIDDIFDYFALRIVLPDKFYHGQEFVGHCYEVLGLLHKRFYPLPDRLKDYIQRPKLNGYRSIHTTIGGLSLSSDSMPVEVQIRTQSMDEEATYGLAAHWLYAIVKNFATESIESKDSLSAGKTIHETMSGTSLALSNEWEWLRNLRNVRASMALSQELVQKFALELFKDRIFVMTSAGTIVDLPAGATAVDFAYALDTKLGHRCTGAQIDGRLAPLDYCLQNGQVVSILLKPHEEPNRYWLSFVRSEKAKTEISQWFNSVDKEKNVILGKMAVDRYVRSMDSQSKFLKRNSFNLHKIRHYFDNQHDAVYEKIGCGDLTIEELIFKFLQDRKHSSNISHGPLSSESPLSSKQLADKVIVSGFKGLSIRLAECCKPVIFQNIIGYITRGRGVSVHRADCPFINTFHRERLLEVKWEE